jgi:hypothetical protein
MLEQTSFPCCATTYNKLLDYDGVETNMRLVMLSAMKISVGSLVLAFMLFPKVALAGQASSEIQPTGTIPSGYATYSLFLICNPEWLASSKSRDLLDLYEQFKAFGRTIGSSNDAVWFWLKYISPQDSNLAKNIDVERSVRFCQQWKLKPSAGPHLVVTYTYPDESNLSSGLPADSAVYELGDMKSEEIVKLLSELTDHLISMRTVGYSAAPPVTPSVFWQHLLESTRRTINNFGCAWSFKIDAGPVSADLHSCQQQK